MLELNTVYQGDCLEVMSSIEDKTIDMILCDLPYGTSKCKWDIVIPFELLWQHYKRIIKDSGAIVLTASQPFTSKLVLSNLKMFKYCMVWWKSNPSNIALANKQPLKYHEDIVIFYKNQPTYNKEMVKRDPKGTERILAGRKSGITFKMSATEHQSIDKKTVEYSPNRYDPMLKNPSSIVRVGVERGKLHPTQKPTALFEYLIKTYTNPGDLVLDNCAGSGTTGIACIHTGRNYILIEQDLDYVTVIKTRLKEFLHGKI